MLCHLGRVFGGEARERLQSSTELSANTNQILLLDTRGTSKSGQLTASHDAAVDKSGDAWTAAESPFAPPLKVVISPDETIIWDEARPGKELKVVDVSFSSGFRWLGLSGYEYALG